MNCQRIRFLFNLTNKVTYASVERLFFGMVNSVRSRTFSTLVAEPINLRMWLTHGAVDVFF